MKSIIVIFFLIIGNHSLSQVLSRNVLFIGNSYTQVNNLPQIIADAAASAGDLLTFDSNTPGGATLMQHTTNSVTQAKIMSGGWDYVVLQGQSQEPILDEFNFFSGAVNLKNLIKQYNPCSVPLFYMTWGRKNGDALNCPNIPIMCTYEGMDTTIKNSYIGATEYLRGELSPVSVLWKYLRLNYPTIELYQTDESHPSAAGSYAAACSFYASIFGKDPTLITFDYTLSPTIANIIRNAAKTIVYDNLISWDFKQLPNADFLYATGNGVNEVNFTNLMQNSDNFLWNFGDGTSSTTQVNPIHSYPNNGTYTVTLTAWNCDLNGQHQSTHSVNISFCAHTPSISPDPVMICPDSAEVLWTELGDSYQWYENGLPLSGATNQNLVLSAPISNTTISVKTSSNGCSELSKSTFVERHHWATFWLTIITHAEGNIFDDNKVCFGDSLVLIATVLDTHLSQWYRNDVLVPFANSDTLITTQSGNYKVKIDHPVCPNMGEFSGSWGDSLNFEFISCPLTVPEFGQQYITLTPNPASDLLTVQAKEEIKEIEILNMLGVRMETFEKDSNTIDVSMLPNGTYIIRVISENDNEYFSKFLKK